MGLVIYTTGLLPPPSTGVFIATDGRLCSHISHLCFHQEEYYKAKSLIFSYMIFSFSSASLHQLVRR